MPGAGRVGDVSAVATDAHGCPACPHTASGPAAAGSPDVAINGRAALRVGDRGRHAGCCGPNAWEVAGGAPGVYVNGRRAARAGDLVTHCGGAGALQAGSPDVVIGDHGGAAPAPATRPRWGGAS